MKKTSKFFSTTFFICVLLFTSSCETVNDSVKITLENASSKNISSYYIESGYVNVSEDPIYEFGKGSNNAVGPGETFDIALNVSENGSGNFEAVKVSVTVDGIEYSNEDSYLYYHNEGTNSTITATVRDKYDSTVYISLDFGLWD